MRLFHNNTYTLWYHPTSLSGNPPIINTGNGWVQVPVSSTVSTIAAGITPIFSNMSLVIPANTTYRFALVTATGSPYFANNGAGPNQFSSGGVEIYTQNNPVCTTYIGPPTGPISIYPRGFYGSITFIPGYPCTTPPVAGVAHVSNANPCGPVDLTLSLTGVPVSAGMTFQWESSPNIAGPYTPISGATNYTQVVQSTTTLYYRAAVTCSGMTDYSDPVLVTVPTAFPGGNYTINASLPTAGTNFNSFTEAAAAIACGISGPVVFDIDSASGPYIEQIVLPSTIGSDANKPVTFNGNGATISFNGTATDPFTFGIDGADYITVNRLYIESANSTYALACHLWNNADHNTFNNCTFYVSPTSLSSSACPISISGSRTSAFQAGASGNNNVIDNCTMVGGYFGASFYGNNGGANTGNQIKNSRLDDFHMYGVYNFYNNGTVIDKNILDRSTRVSPAAFYGIYIGTGSLNTQVTNNIVRNPFTMAPTQNQDAYGIYSTIDATVGNENVYINNLIYGFEGNGSHHGIYLSGADHIKVYHNTVVLDDVNSTVGSAYGILSTGTTAGIQIKNNNVYISRGGSSGEKYGLYYSNGLKTSDYNNVYVNCPGTPGYFGYFSGNRATLAHWQLVNNGLFDANGSELDPMFADPAARDFSPTNSLLDNTGTFVGVATDIFDATRNATTPDIGAIEFTLPQCFGQPTAGTATVNATELCPGGSFVLTLTGFTVGAGIEIQWEESPVGANAWTPIAGGNSPTFLHTQPSVFSEYRAVVTCTAGGQSDVSNTVSVDLLPFYVCYCSPNTGVQLHNNSGNLVSTIEIPGTPLSANSSSMNNLSGYYFHDPSIPSNTADLVAGQVYTITFAVLQAGNVVEMWVDWDQSGTFDPLEYMMMPQSTNVSHTFTVPGTAVPGLTGMRIRTQANNSVVYGPNGACFLINQGSETEDFVLNIVPPAPCSGIPSIVGTASINKNSICYNSSVELVLTGAGIAPGLVFQWEESPAGLNNWTAIPGATTDTFIVANVVEDMDYRMMVTCTSPGGGTDYSNIVSVTVSNPPIVSTTPGSRCGTGTVDLTAVPDAGYSVKWYDVAAGGHPVGTGNNFTTPVLQNTTTYYATAAMTGGNINELPMPAHGSVLVGNARGYHFTAPTSFTITGLEVPVQATGGQSIAVIKFNPNAQIPGWGSSTNDFTVLYLTQNNAATGLIPVNIPVNQGDVIGILGQIANSNSLATPAGPYVSEIAGFPVTLSRLGMEYMLNTNAPQDVYEEPVHGIGRINMKYEVDCEGARVPVVATVNPTASITASAANSTICIGSSTTLDVTSANSGYTYTWNPGGSGSSIVVNPATTTTYVVDAVDASNCTATDTIEVVVLSVPASVATVTTPYAICASGNITISLDPEPMPGVTYQWQMDEGNGFVDIVGATSSLYSAAVTGNTVFQAQMFCNSTLLGTSVPGAVEYSNPTIAEVLHGSRCDAGPVTLAAIASRPDATIRWYTSAIGGTHVATGGAFTTTSITSDTTYYVSALAGGGVFGDAGPADPTSVGPGAGSSAPITTYYTTFDVFNPGKLISVDIYPVDPVGTNGAISVTDASNNVLINVPYTTTVTGGNTPQTVAINLQLAPGTGYRIGQSTAISLFRNSSGSSYPYTSPSISITGNNFDLGYYFYFYNWQYESACESPRVPVTASINGTSSGTGLATGGTTQGTFHGDGTTVDYTDGCGDVVASITDAPGGNALGITSAIVITAPTVHDLNGTPYVARIFDLNPASPGPATVKLYALQSEFDAYNNYVTSNGLNLPLLPTGPSDLAGIANIAVTQFHGSALNGNSGPGGLYDVTNYSFIPNSSITANWTGSYWTLSFPVTGFSGFFIHSGGHPLDIELKHITAANFGKRNRVDWTTGKETAGDYFILERSADGKNFSELATRHGQGSLSIYSHWDEQPYTGKNYYRLKMMNAAGRMGYSPIVVAEVTDRSVFAVEAYPNPATELLTVSVYGDRANNATISIADVTGKAIRVIKVTDSKTEIDMSGLAQGVYLVKYSDDLRSETIKVTRQ